ncbi:MAG: FAD-binding protein [Thermomicrobiales bacterium]
MSEVGNRREMATIERPDSVADLARFVAETSRSGRPFLIRGGGTHARFSNDGADVDAVVETTSLNQVIDYSPVDLTLAVEPGVRIAEIDGLLTERSQRLALDMPHRSQATIGGTFAAGLSGPRRLRYGALKDMVIGADVVTSSGEIAKSGGMVVKNVSGYEIARLHYGAHGAFGPVSRLNLKVLPIAESRVEVRCAFESASDSVMAATSVLVSSLDPAAVYVTNSRPGTWTLHVQIEGNKRFTDLQRETVVEHVARVIRPSGVEMGDLEGNSTPAFDRVLDLVDADDVIVARLSVPASKQADLLSRLTNESNREILADTGSGLVYVRTDATSDGFVQLADIGQPVVYLALPDAFRPGVDVFGTMDSNAARIVQRLKDEYDPDRIFNPGRFSSFL